MSGTGYYEEQLGLGLIPPAYVGTTWGQRDPSDLSKTVQSPFPPATIGVPAEDFEPFLDFRAHAGASLSSRHPEWYCPGGCGRFSTPAVCPSKTCGPHGGSARCEPLGQPTDDGTEQDHRCLTCGSRFLALLLCGPCRADRGVSARPKTSPPVRAPASRSGRAVPQRRSA